MEEPEVEAAELLAQILIMILLTEAVALAERK
jgi:hypothetical protein